VLNGHLAVAKFLVKKGANKKAKDDVGTVNTLLNESRVCTRCLWGTLPIRE
jgi:hypothetical protein